MPNDKSMIFIYCEGKIIEGKICKGIINDEFIETIEKYVDKLDENEIKELHTTIMNNYF